MFRTLDLGADKLLPGDEPARKRTRPWAGGRCASASTGRPFAAAVARAAAGGRRAAAVGDVPDGSHGGGVPRCPRAAADARRGACARRRRQLRIGTMLEVPALMWQLPELLRERISSRSGRMICCSFCSRPIGAPALSGRYDLLSPPVLDLLEHAFGGEGGTRRRRAGVAVRRGGMAPAGGAGAGRRWGSARFRCRRRRLAVR